jgi:Autotransporter beta-domain
MRRLLTMKAKVVSSVIGILLLVLPGFSSAAEKQEDYSLSSDKITQAQNYIPKYNLEFALMYWKLDYKEDIPAPRRSTENGWLPGVYMGITYNSKNDFYSKIFVEFSYSDVEFDGTTQSGTPVKFSSDNNQFFFRGEFDVGYNFAVARNISIKPYTGYGYRHWERGQASVTATYVSYKEKYYWHYIPVGVAADINFGNRVVIEPNVGLRIMFYGKMIAYFSELDPTSNDPEFKLGNKIGYYAELPVRYKFSQNWSLVVKPWYEYSEFGESDTVDLTTNGVVTGAAYEPSSRTHLYGVNLGFVYSF